MNHFYQENSKTLLPQSVLDLQHILLQDILSKPNLPKYGIQHLFLILLDIQRKLSHLNCKNLPSVIELFLL